MNKGKYGQDLAKISDNEFAEFLLKFAFMTPEQMEERDNLPTKEARREFMRNLPLPQLQRKGN
jgi:hypothetical protein